METNTQYIRLAFFSSKEDIHQKKIAHLASELIPDEQITTCDTATDFLHVIRKMLCDCGIILILVRSAKELAQIINIKDRLENRSMVLILPDTGEDIMKQGLKIYPRYISYIKNDYKDIFFVLKKMIAKIQKRAKGKEDGPGNRDD